jgi:hypothetical protein
MMVRTFLKTYMRLGSCFLFLQEQIKDIIIYFWFLEEQIKDIIIRTLPVTVCDSDTTDIGVGHRCLVQKR